MGLASSDPSYSVPEVYGFVHETFNGDELFQSESFGEFWNAVISKRLEVGNKRQMDVAVSRYSSSNRRLIEYLVNDLERVWARPFLEALPVWTGWLPNLGKQDEKGKILSGFPHLLDDTCYPGVASRPT